MHRPGDRPVRRKPDARRGDRFGRIAAALRKAGTPIPTNDIWIAAHAFETGAELITFDRHFDHVRSLPVTTLPGP
jgi:tRNA(fMet)-specific endonuclease VapC